MSLLRRLFGPSRAEIWRKLAAELHAQFVPGSIWKGDAIRVEHGGWTLVLDTYFSAASKITYTRLRAPFHNPEHFRFTLYRRGLFSDIAKWLGMQDVTVGHAAFDRDFIVKGNHERRLRALLHDARLHALLEAQREVHFTVQDDTLTPRDRREPDSDELCFTLVGVVKDAERVRGLFELFAETLERLQEIGVADEKRRS